MSAPPAHRLEPGGWRRARQEWLLLCAMLVAVALTGAGSRYVEHRHEDAAQRHLLQVQAGAVHDILTGQLAGVVAAMRGVRADLTGTGSVDAAQRAERRFRALAGALPGVRTQQLLNREGRVLASNRPELVGRDFSAREYFRQAQAQPDAQRVSLSAPFVSVLGVYAMNVTVAMPAADGSFGGVVTATLDPEYFRNALRSMLHAPDMWAAAIHGDGLVAAREPPLESAGPLTLNLPGSMLRRHLDAGQAAGVLTGPSAIDGEMRYVALRTVQPATMGLDKPLVVAVSRSVDAIFAPWWRQTLAVAAFYAALVVVAAVALTVVQRRRRAFEALQAKQDELQRQGAERLELALRGADLGLWDLDVKSGTTTVNERWNSMLGLPHQAQYAGDDSWAARLHPEDWPRVQAAQSAHLAGRTDRFEQVFRMQHAEGHWVWILDRASVTERSADGQPLRMVGTHMDTTSWMESRLAMERSERSLATTLNSIGDAVIATDPQGHVVRMNATAERLTGWPLAEALGQPLGQVFQIRDATTRELAVDPVQQVIARGAIVELAEDTLLVSRNGIEYQIADSAAPIRLPGGDVTGVVLVFSDVTERYRVQQALRTNEHRLRSLLDNLRAGVIVHGPDSQVLDANPSACEMIGLTLDQMRGKMSIDPSWAFLEEDHTPMLHDRFPVLQVLASGGPVQNLVLGVRRPDLPKPVWVLVNAYPVRGTQGQIEQIVVTFSDITERKEAEERLHDSEDLKASVLDSLSAHIAVLDQQGVVISVNEAWRRFARSNGAPADLVDPAGQSYLLGCACSAGGADDDDVAKVLAGVRAVLAGQQTEFQAEYPCHAPSEDRWFRVSVTPLKGARGGVVVSHVSVTELRIAAQTVQAAKAELQATLEAVPDLLFEIDLDGCVQNFHSPRRELLYVPPEVFLGRSLPEFLPPAVVAVIRQAMDQAQACGFSTGLQYELALPDGAHWFELSAARRPMPPGEPARFILLARDISDRKRAELERELLERQLREAQKMESIGTLAGGIAHDFNNILASILGNVALARADEDVGLPVRASLDQIHRAGLRARLLVQQILTFSRRDHGVFSQQLLVPVIDETVALLKATLPAGVRLDAVLPASSPAVWGDATQLQQVLMNLCTNAWHALPETGGCIEVGAEALAPDEAQRCLPLALEPGPLVHLWVRDNGCGMDEATRDRIFDPFFTTKPVGRGTGLGLSVVHGIVRAHGGALTVDSAPGQGTTFHLYFPAAEAPELLAATVPAPAALARGTGQRVLYIDDDEVMSLMVERLLLLAGFQVKVQTDAVAAVALFRARPQDFDAVVTDYNMPVISGLEVLRQVLLIRPGLPVVLSSGYLPEELRAEALAAGALALLQKENTFAELARVLQQVLAEGATA